MLSLPREKCGTTKEIKEGQAVPECCGQPMAPVLPVCELSSTAEHSRPDEGMEPCDDGRSGKV